MNQQRKNIDYKAREEKLDKALMIYGKVPPKAVQFESAILGAIMLEKDALDRVIEKLPPEAFYDPRHQALYAAMLEMKAGDNPIDYLTVVDYLTTTGQLENLGGAYFITKLTTDVVSSANIEYHAQIVHERFIMREVIRTAGELLTMAFREDADIEEVQTYIEKELLPIGQQSGQKGAVTIQTVLMQAMVEIDQQRQLDTHITGIPSGHQYLDLVTCGWQRTDLIILAARPAVGKTAMALSLVKGAAKEKKKVAVFSLEMSALQMVKRMMADEGDTFLSKIRDARLDDYGMEKLYRRGVQPLANLGIWIDDDASINIIQFKARARRLVRLYGVDLIIVDYLQLMSGSGKRNGTREQEISEISRELKKTAKELSVPIIALSQLSREIEKRSDPKPILADLRESGAIEQDADMVCFLYNPNSEKAILEDAALREQVYLKIAKYRNGSLEEFEFKFEAPFQRFTEIQPVNPYTHNHLNQQKEELRQKRAALNMLPEDPTF